MLVYLSKNCPYYITFYYFCQLLEIKALYLLALILIMIKNHYLTMAFGLSGIIMVIGFSLFYVQFLDEKNLLIIHFESLKGVDFLGTKMYVLGILMSGLAINIINFLVSVALFNRRKVFSYLIAIMSVIFSLLILLTIVVIMSIN